MTNPITYTEFSSLMKSGNDITSMLNGNCRKYYYKDVLNEAIEERDNAMIEALAANLPLEAWFDKDAVLKNFRDTLSGKIYDAKKYTWCMTIPAIRACFTPEEKGHFVHVGFVVDSHQMVYHATLDHDWKRELPDHIIEVELKRLKGFNVKRLNKNHPNIDYFKWFSNEFFPHFSQKDCHLYLLGSLCLTVGQLREISEHNSLAEIDFLKEKDDKEPLKKMMSDLKDSIEYLKTELHFNDWTDEFRNSFIKLITSPVASAVSSMTDTKELESFAEQLPTIVRYNKLEQQIDKKEEPRKKKTSKV